MKWTKETDKRLTELINLGKRYNEISFIFGVSYRTIANRCFRIGLKPKYNEECNCKYCGNSFIKLISSPQIFCSSTCSATYNNRNRKHSEETKKKIGLAIKNNGRRKTKITTKITTKIKKERYCRNCDLEVFNRKIICDDCRYKYYNFYRPSCEFTFDIKKYKDKFDFKLVEKHGWYSPSNKGNNLNGVSRDHLYSVKDGFINNVQPEIIKHPANCKLMIHKDNNFKNFNSSITLDELLKRIEEWDNCGVEQK